MTTSKKKLKKGAGKRRTGIKRDMIPNIPDPSNHYAVADWAELYVLLFGRTLSRATLIRHIDMATGGTDSDVNAIWQELKRRIELYGPQPPYVVQDEHLEPQFGSWEKRPAYMMCLLLSMLGNQHDTISTGTLFERLSAIAINTYLGGQSILYGKDRPKLKVVAYLLNERFATEPSTNFNDRGVDLIAWKPFPDTRSSQLILLLQCASGWNWKRKTRDISQRAWDHYIHWAAAPSIGFTIPGIVARDNFDDIADDAGIILDRARLYTNVPKLPRSLNSDVKKWCKRKIPTIFH